MAEKFPTSTDEAQSSFSHTEIRDAETGEILRQQISSRLENDYTSANFQYVTANGSELISPASNSSTDIQTQITMPTCFSLRETSKVIDTSRPDITQTVNTLCNISDMFSYREHSRVDSSDSSDESMSGDSPVSRAHDKSQIDSLSCQDTISSVTKKLELALAFNRENCTLLDPLNGFLKSNPTPCDFKRYLFHQAHPFEICLLKKASENSSNSFRQFVRRFAEPFHNGNFAGPSKSRTDESMSSSGCLDAEKPKLCRNYPRDSQIIDVTISNSFSNFSSTESSLRNFVKETKEESQNYHSHLAANTATGGSDLSNFDRFRKAEYDQPVNISPKYPCSGAQICVSADLNSGRDQSTSDIQMDAKTKFPSTSDLTKTRLSKRLCVDEPLDLRKSKYSRLEIKETLAVPNSSSDIQLPLLMDEDISGENSHFQDVDQMNTMGKSEGDSSKSYE